jgi:hypothetical protein
MESSTTDSGKIARGMDEENRSGKMEPSMRATGGMIWQTERED